METLAGDLDSDQTKSDNSISLNPDSEEELLEQEVAQQAKSPTKSTPKKGKAKPLTLRRSGRLSQPKGKKIMDFLRKKKKSEKEEPIEVVSEEEETTTKEFLSLTKLKKEIEAEKNREEMELRKNLRNLKAKNCRLKAQIKREEETTRELKKKKVEVTKAKEEWEMDELKTDLIEKHSTSKPLSPPTKRDYNWKERMQFKKEKMDLEKKVARLENEVTMAKMSFRKKPADKRKGRKSDSDSRSSGSSSEEREERNKRSSRRRERKRRREKREEKKEKRRRIRKARKRKREVNRRRESASSESSSESSEPPKKRSKRKESPKKELTCFICKKPGHFASTCYQRKCSYCQKTGHSKNECKKRRKDKSRRTAPPPPQQWYANRPVYQNPAPPSFRAPSNQRGYPANVDPNFHMLGNNYNKDYYYYQSLNKDPKGKEPKSQGEGNLVVQPQDQRVNPNSEKDELKSKIKVTAPQEVVGQQSIIRSSTSTEEDWEIWGFNPEEYVSELMKKVRKGEGKIAKFVNQHLNSKLAKECNKAGLSLKEQKKISLCLNRALREELCKKRGVNTITREGSIVFTDGSYIRENNTGGIGVWYGFNSPKNLALPLHGPKSNNRAELLGGIVAIFKHEEHSPLFILTDSLYLTGGFNYWLPRWLKKVENKGKPPKNWELWCLLELLSKRAKFDIYIEWAKGHADITGNVQADLLAEEGNWMAQKDKLEFWGWEGLELSFEESEHFRKNLTNNKKRKRENTQIQQKKKRKKNSPQPNPKGMIRERFCCLALNEEKREQMKKEFQSWEEVLEKKQEHSPKKGLTWITNQIQKTTEKIIGKEKLPEFREKENKKGNSNTNKIQRIGKQISKLIALKSWGDRTGGQKPLNNMSLAEMAVRFNCAPPHQEGTQSDWDSWRIKISKIIKEQLDKKRNLEFKLKMNEKIRTTNRLRWLWKVNRKACADKVLKPERRKCDIEIHCLQEAFAKSFQSNLPEGVLPEFWDKLPVRPKGNNWTAQVELFFREIKNTEIESTFKNHKKLSAPGDDGLTYSILRLATVKMTETLAIWFTRILRGGAYPNSWGKGILSVINK
eukprot:CAMPEP_0174256958 /NCGR_PEP_ID=MMETSP0439-20130205/6152_1 /TAXON_ID=0 /ORGANISM="Stereomyxa ramosa, Strain Chinc5" /LENGTH=1073 /DNA_ID=CAMNT_0015339823 /DNA_START=167 /DNA_END=3385 /DNA_ORIENTATION=-